MVDRIPLILFSGGLDSTFLLEQELRKGPVDVLYVAASQSQIKIKAERLARRKLINTLERITGNHIRNEYDIDIKSGCQTPDSTFQQPLMWLNGAFEISSSKIHSELQVGYVMGDQINAWLGSIERAWWSIQEFGKVTPIPLLFPLKQFTKQDILNEIHPKLVSKVWICEMPTYTTIGNSVGGEDTTYHTCKQCLPCKTMASQLYLWKLTHQEDYGKYIIRKLNNLEKHIENLI